MERTRCLTVLIFALMLGLTAGVANAVPIAYEPFGYTPGSDLDGQNGGQGWDGAWSSTAGIFEAESGSLVHPTLDILAEGNHGLIHLDGIYTRALPAGTFVADGTTYWASWLFQLIEGEPWVLPLGWQGLLWVNDEEMGFWCDSLGSEFNFDWADPLDVHWVVLKFETTGGGDITVYGWLDPDPGSEPAIGTADGSQTMSFFEDYTEVNTGFEGSLHVDEIRYGTTWQDVTYDPKSASDPSPFTGKVNVDPALALLEWVAPTEVCTPLYDVYFGTDSTVANNPKLLDNSAATSVEPNDPAVDGSLALDTQYYWRVDVNDPNCDAQCQNCVPGYVMRTGATWGFTTWPPEPIILTQPENTLAPPGGTAQFDIVSGGNLAGSHTFTWYKQVGATRDEPNDVVVKGPTGPAGSDTLTITNATYDPDILLSDEAPYYCKVTNTVPGTTYSDTVGLVLLRLMAKYRFNGNAQDSVSLYHATGVGGFGWAGGGIQGLCLNLDGSTGYAYVPFIIGESVGTFEDFTISTWVNPDVGEGRGVIWAGYDDTAGGPPSGGDGISIERTANGGAFVRIAGNDPETISVAGAIPQDEWTHVVFVYDSNDAVGAGTVYINGEQAGQVEYDTASAQQIGPVSMGAYVPDGGPARWFLDGQLDEVRFYAYPITAVNVASLYNEMTSDPVCTGNPEADHDDSCDVELVDYAKMLSNWLASNIVQ